jgi:hypothetical protein
MMEYHQARLEYWQGIIDKAEQEALVKARQQIYDLPSRKDGLVPDENYLAKTLLKDNFRYNRAIGNRNGHERGVNVYAALYLAESVHK